MKLSFIFFELLTYKKTWNWKWDEKIISLKLYYKERIKNKNYENFSLNTKLINLDEITPIMQQGNIINANGVVTKQH
jgi:hypothetical protein